MIHLSDFFQLGPIPNNAMYGTYSTGLVVLSYVIACFASYIALDVAGRLRAEQNKKIKWYWLIGGALAMGAGIWSMHFVGMLAFIMDMPMFYEPFWTGISLIIAVVCSAFALFLLRDESESALHLILGGVVLGIGINAMHYTGMRGMTGTKIHYTPGLFGLSVLIAIVAAEAALWLMIKGNQGSFSRKQLFFKVGSALFMGAAICGMHYTGMAAAVFTPVNGAHVHAMKGIDPYFLALYVSIVTGSILTIALIVSTYKQLMTSAIQNEKDFLNAVLNNLSDGVLACDAKGKITVFNPALQKLIELDPLNNAKEQWTDYFSFSQLDKKAGSKRLIFNAFSGKKIKDMELDLILKNSSVKHKVIINGQPIFNQYQEKLGEVITVHDITKQKRLEEQLRAKNEELEAQNCRVQEANRLKSEFLANMSHELRTPLNGIIGFAELMHSGKVGPISAEHEEYLGDILSSSKHLLQLINDVLDLAKVESGKMEFYPEKIDTQHLLNEVRDILRTLIAKKQIKLDIVVEPNLCELFIDPAKLKQIVYNYISNAIKFTDVGGQISIRVTPEGEKNFRLEVEDNGIGIREEDLDRLFAEFEQLDTSMSKQFQGTGLGLALTKRIVEAQNGTVGVKSTFGEGSQFYAILPCVSIVNENSLDTTITKSPHSEHRPTILVIEDDANDRQFIVDVLVSSGYNVETAVNGSEALRHCLARTYDAISLDLILPDTNGWELLSMLRREGPNKETPIIILTVVAEKAVGVAFHIHDFLTKPIESKMLLESLDALQIPPHTTKPVIVIDDNIKDLKLAKILLTELGYQVLCVSTAQEGLLAAKQGNPLAIILDLLMPGMNGFEFLHQYRKTKKGRQTPVLVWTAKDVSSDERAQLRALSLGVVLKSGGSINKLLSEFSHYLPRAEQ